MKEKNIIPAALVALGIVLLGWFIKSGISDIANKDRKVNVKGLAEQEVEADKVTWPIVSKEMGNNLPELYDKIGATQAKIKSFLQRNGIKDDELTVNAPQVVDLQAEQYNNNFKPYLGFGYEGRLMKNNDRYLISFDCGAMFWGGTPSILTHDGTDLAKDVRDIGGKVGTYVDLIKGVKVFPILNVRLTKTIF